MPGAVRVPRIVTSVSNVAVPEHVRAPPKVVAPMTPNVVEHVALVIVVLPVTLIVPEQEAFTRLASPAQVNAPIVYVAVVLSAICR